MDFVIVVLHLAQENCSYVRSMESSSFSYRNIPRIDWRNLELIWHLSSDVRLSPVPDWEILPRAVFQHSEKQVIWWLQPHARSSTFMVCRMTNSFFEFSNPRVRSWTSIWTFSSETETSRAKTINHSSGVTRRNIIAWWINITQVSFSPVFIYFTDVRVAIFSNNKKYFPGLCNSIDRGRIENQYVSPLASIVHTLALSPSLTFRLRQRAG